MRFGAGVASRVRSASGRSAGRASAGPAAGVRAQPGAAGNGGLAVLLGYSPRALVTAPVERGAAIDALTLPPAVPAGTALGPPRAPSRRAAGGASPDSGQCPHRPGEGWRTIRRFRLRPFWEANSASLSDLFSAQARVWQIGGSAAQTIFDAGRTRQQVEQARAREQQLLARYASAIQNAFKDTLDALVAQAHCARSIGRRAGACPLPWKPPTNSHNCATTTAFQALLDVLDVERGLLDAELNRSKRSARNSLPLLICSRLWAEAGTESWKWRNPPRRTKSQGREPP